MAPPKCSTRKKLAVAIVPTGVTITDRITKIESKLRFF
jgi:hypothetical protein